MAGKKRTRNGQVKALDTPAQTAIDAPATDPTPLCAQPLFPSSTTTESQSTTKNKVSAATTKPAAQKVTGASKPASTTKPTSKNLNHQKLPKLPPNLRLTKRPLLHAPIPTPFSSSSSPKIIYINPSSPFIPTIKRVRKLLSEISKRAKQSQQGLGKKKKSSGVGGLRSEDVERDIVDASQTGKGTGGKGGTGERVYLKASGRAIPRALEVGVEMQDEGCVVQIEMGSVRAVDDVQVLRGMEGDVGGEVEETRIRNVSCVTVSIWEK